MKKIIGMLFLISTITWANSELNLKSINQLSQIMQNDLEVALNCFPQINSHQVKFCTGEKINDDLIAKILSPKSLVCQKMIEQKGYRIINQENHQTVDKSLWDSFFYSTKNAETIHKEKYVFFKSSYNQIDCLHEFIHVLQWSSKNKNPLSPSIRNAKYSELEKKLLKISDLLPSFYAKNPQMFKELTSYTQNKIDLLKKYSTISSWLDEKDVYGFLYYLCQKRTKCTIDDWDTILGNLFLLKDKLPWKIKNEITQVSLKRLREKEETALDQTTYIELGPEDYKEIDSLFSKSWEDLIFYLRSKNINLYQFITSDKKIDSGDTDKISPTLLQSLPTPNKENLVSLLGYSKINQGFVLGKFLCTIDKRESFIIITNKSSREKLIHEYMHYLQSLKNPIFCLALTEQKNLEQEFKRGKINRNEFENKILEYKVIIWKTEHEVYSYLSKRPNPNEFENSNNKIQLLMYSTRLKKETDLGLNLSTDIKKISFEIKEDLPIIKIFDRPLVLDLGAMDSVISPKLIFEHVPFLAIVPLKMKTLMNTTGDSIDAPLVKINHPVLLNDQTINQSNWVLANLKLPMADGVLGLNFFKDKEIILYPKKKLIEFTHFSKKPSQALLLQKDYNNEVKAIEFICPQNNLIVRLDSGSQVYGDLKSNLPNTLKNKLINGSGFLCGKLLLKGNFNSNIQNDVIFSHQVGLNLGWPWIKTFEKVSISIKNGWILFE